MTADPKWLEAHRRARAIKGNRNKRRAIRAWVKAVKEAMR